MKNFDESRAARRRPEDARSFVIGGQTFVLKQGVRPEALAVFDAISNDSSIPETMGAWDSLFLELVEDREDAHTRYMKLRQDTIDPLTIDDLQELVMWMMEQVTGRPTGSPSGSTAEPEGTGTLSTVASSLPGLQAA